MLGLLRHCCFLVFIYRQFYSDLGDEEERPVLIWQIASRMRPQELDSDFWPHGPKLRIVILKTTESANVMNAVRKPLAAILTMAKTWCAKIVTE